MINDDIERSLLFKEGFITFPKGKEHVTLCRTTEEALDFGQEVEAGVRGNKAEPLLGFPQERQGRARETL